MRNGAVRYLILFTVLLFLAFSLVAACGQPNMSPPLTPSEPPPTPSEPPLAQPSPVSENKTAEEPPPVTETVAATSSPVVITYIRYKGTVYLPTKCNCFCYPRNEPDEYVVIKNLSESPVEMGGWVLRNITKGYPSFTFPLNFIFGPGQIVRVYTDEIYPECGAWLEFGTDSKAPYCESLGKIWFSFNWGAGDIWSNETPNIAVLYDAKGNEISRKSYAVSAEMNEAASE